jgi:hypothetical protein
MYLLLFVGFVRGLWSLRKELRHYSEFDNEALAYRSSRIFRAAANNANITRSQHLESSADAC